ncbi:MAG TPA: serine/threonine-protein kinase [Ktedonobacteraceae bacterium]
MSDQYPYEGAIFGEYKLKSGLGHGGTADVYLAEDTNLERDVAIKVIHNSRMSQPEEIDEFQREGRTLARLEHPYIIPVYYAGIEKGVPYIVMKYARGSVRQKYPHKAVLPFETVIKYTVQAAQALQYIHNQGLIHRDVKPENLLLNSAGDLQVSDFGIAIPTASRRIAREEIVGTATYMSPEQFDARVVRQSDQYALGIVTFEWLTGSLPFTITTSGDAAYKHLKLPVPPMVRDGQAIAPEIAAVVTRALAKNPVERFATIIEFAQALKVAIRLSALPAL